MIARSYLFIPGNNATMLEKAHTRGADALIIDFEDAVAVHEKERARELFSTWIDSAPNDQQIWVRINQSSIDADLAVADHEKVHGIVVPKADVENIKYVSKSLTRVSSLCALIESAASILDAREIAKMPRIDFLQIGELDLRAQLSMSEDGGLSTLNFACSMLVLASAAAGINPPIAPIYPDFLDDIALRESSRVFKGDGFFGRTCIHPRQISIINKEFTTSDEELAHAHAVLDAIAKSTGAAVDENGKMIDAASVKIAQAMIANRRLPT